MPGEWAVGRLRFRKRWLSRINTGVNVTLMAAGMAVLVFGALLYPAIVPVMRLRKREWRAHRGHVLHWYANFDENLHYEPCYEADIVPLTLSEVIRRGYSSTKIVMIVPRTLRGRVAGARQLTLWKSSAPDAAPMWLCTPPRAMLSIAYAVDAGPDSPGRSSLPAVDSQPARRHEPLPDGPDVVPAAPLNWNLSPGASPDLEAPSGPRADDSSLTRDAGPSFEEVSGANDADDAEGIAPDAASATNTTPAARHLPRKRKNRRRGRRA